VENNTNERISRLMYQELMVFIIENDGALLLKMMGFTVESDLLLKMMVIC